MLSGRPSVKEEAAKQAGRWELLAQRQALGSQGGLVPGGRGDVASPVLERDARGRRSAGVRLSAALAGSGLSRLNFYRCPL